MPSQIHSRVKDVAIDKKKLIKSPISHQLNYNQMNRVKRSTMNYVTPKKAAEILGVHASSLRRGESEGKLLFHQNPWWTAAVQTRERSKKQPFNPNQLSLFVMHESRLPTQRDNLERLLEFLRSRFPEAELLSDIGSGLNFRRRKFFAILDRILRGNIQRLVVAHPNRLVRFGFELVKWLCERTGCFLLVFNERKLSPEPELITDMLSSVHYFSSRLYGLRKYFQ